MVTAKEVLEYSKQIKVLYVEDDEALRRNTIELLNTFFNETVQAINGAEGLKAYQSDQFDLVITDLRMPVMDGVEMCNRIKQLDFNQYIIVLSAHDESHFLQELINMGVDYFLLKPLNIQKFLPVIHRVCKQIVNEKNVKELAAQRDEYTAKLAQLNHDKDMLFSLVSHDLRTPFSGLLGLTQLLLERYESYDTTQIKEYLNDIHASSQRVYDLLENLLTWVRLQMGNMTINPAKINPGRLANECIEVLSNLAKQKNILIHNKIDQAIEVIADEHMIRSVIHNLITNAIKFSHQNGTITLSAEHKPRKILFFVEDEGVGMSPEQLEALLQGCTGGSTLGTAQEKGTGLGLVLCREMIEKNGGSMIITSSQGQGSSFGFQLQIMADA